MSINLMDWMSQLLMVDKVNISRILCQEAVGGHIDQ